MCFDWSANGHFILFLYYFLSKFYFVQYYYLYKSNSILPLPPRNPASEQNGYAKRATCDIDRELLALWCMPTLLFHKPSNNTANILIIQVSDALVKLQKTPEGSTPRAGYLADLGKPSIQRSPTPLYITPIIPLTYTRQYHSPPQQDGMKQCPRLQPRQQHSNS